MSNDYIFDQEYFQMFRFENQVCELKKEIAQLKDEIKEIKSLLTPSPEPQEVKEAVKDAQDLLDRSCNEQYNLEKKYCTFCGGLGWINYNFTGDHICHFCNGTGKTLK